MISKCWKDGDSEVDVIVKLKAAMLELKLIIDEGDVNASDVDDLRAIIDRLNEAVLLLQLQR
jgi:hypothetical protein